MTWEGWAEGRNAKARAKGRWREVRDFDALGPRGGLADGRRVVAFASNDYLGLSAHPEVVAAGHDALRRWGAGAGASRLVSGSRPVHRELEAQLAGWKSTEAAVLFPTGYMANLGVLSALAGPDVLICSDALNHASIVDGCRLAGALGAQVKVYHHVDTEAVAGLLAGTEAKTKAVVVTDTVFSMDGDQAPVEELARVCGRYGALLVLDEAHAVLGPHYSQLPCEVLRVGTLSKTLGSLGGFVAGKQAFVDMLINRSRSFIYTTAPSPVSAATALAAIGILRSEQGARLVARLAGYATTLRPGATSPIIPVVVGSEEAALAASSALLEEGIFVPAIRPPTVPPGTCRLRVTLSAAHSDEEVEHLRSMLARHGWV
jgi:8-amino-7-oxononanoate synthase